MEFSGTGNGGEIDEERSEEKMEDWVTADVR